MKTLLLKTFALTAFVIISFAAISQDKIYKKNQDVILCKVVEIGEEAIKYTMTETDDLVYVMDKDRIEKIVFENGKEITFSKRMMDPESYQDQNKTAWKMGFFSPLTSLNVGYERSLKPGKSIEGTLGFIGLGITDIATTNNPGGAYIKAGYKFIMTPDYELKGMKYSHLLKGFYFKPEVAFSFYERDFDQRWTWPGPGPTVPTIRKSVTAGALLLNFGKQWVMSDVFLVDLYFGIGYGFDNITGEDYGYSSEYYSEPQYHYGFALGGEVPIAFTGGLKVGFLTK